MDANDDADRGLMSETVDAISEAVCTTIDRGWRLSQPATLLALARTLTYLALEHLRAHPANRAAIVAMLRGVADCVEVDTATKQ